MNLVGQSNSGTSVDCMVSIFTRKIILSPGKLVSQVFGPQTDFPGGQIDMDSNLGSFIY